MYSPREANLGSHQVGRGVSVAVSDYILRCTLVIMIFLSQPSTNLKLCSHPTLYGRLCIKLLSIRDIRVFLQLVHRPVRVMAVRRGGRRIMV